MPTQVHSRPASYRGIVVVWLLLMGFTLVSWAISASQNGELGTGAHVVPAILIVTFVKIRLVIVHFMEVHEVPAALRAPFEVWCVAVCAALIYVLLPNGILS